MAYNKQKSIAELQKEFDEATGDRRRKKQYIRKVSSGLCVYCGRNSAVRGTRSCDECKEKYKHDTRKYSRAWRLEKIKTGFCSHCGNHPQAPGRKLCRECGDYFREKSRENYHNNREAWHSRSKKGLQRLKLEVFNAYGGPKCNCCGETELMFLTLDHVNNDGNAHRKSLTGNSHYNGDSRETYNWAKKNNFPPSLQILCMNCNMGKHLNKGVCPHKRED